MTRFRSLGAALAVLLAVSACGGGSKGSPDKDTADVTSPSAADTDADRAEAMALVSRSVGDLLGYDYRTIDGQESRVTAYLTSGYAPEYLRTAKEAWARATRLKAVVTATAVESGICGGDDEKLKVLALVDQKTRRAGEDTTIRNAVELTLIQESGGWLVDEVASGGGCEADNPRSRTAVLDAGRRFAIGVVSFTSTDLDAYATSTRTLLTTSFAEEFDDAVDKLRDRVRGKPQTSAGRVLAAAIVEQDRTRAKVLVHEEVSTTLAGKTTSNQRFLLVDLERVDGTWLTSGASSP